MNYDLYVVERIWPDGWKDGVVFQRLEDAENYAVELFKKTHRPVKVFGEVWREDDRSTDRFLIREFDLQKTLDDFEGGTT